MPPTSVPHRLPAADDHRLESENQPRRSDGGIEVGAHGDEHAGHRDDGERQRHAQREDMTVVEPHELRRNLIVGSGAEGPPECRAVENKLQAADHRDRKGELQQRQHPHRDTRNHRNAGDLNGTGLKSAAVGREKFKQAVLDDH